MTITLKYWGNSTDFYRQEHKWHKKKCQQEKIKAFCAAMAAYSPEKASRRILYEHAAYNSRTACQPLLSSYRMRWTKSVIVSSQRIPGKRDSFFGAILMNVKPLLKHFPEIHHLPLEEQDQLLQRASKIISGPENKLRIWRSNMIGLGLLLLVSAALISGIGPYFDLAASTTGVITMMVIFPLFMILQQRRYIARLRPAVLQLIRRE